MIKLIAADLDGTLLAPGGFEMPERTCAAVAKAVSMGVHFVVCTGRIFPGGRKIALAVPGDQPVICVNGAVVRMSRSLEYLRRLSVEPSLISGVLAVIRSFGVHPWFYAGDVCYAEEQEAALENMRQRTGAEVRFVPDLEKLAGCRPEKIIGVTAPERAAELQNSLEARFGAQLYVTRSGKNQVEVLNPQGTKGKALEMVAGMYGIEKHDIAAFGDNFNDLELFRAAGICVAMENGEAELKARADIIAPPNYEAGVGQVLEKLLHL
jgi:Cof subfamily protein (haloacid dehalogenase superfamily)